MGAVVGFYFGAEEVEGWVGQVGVGGQEAVGGGGCAFQEECVFREDGDSEAG